VTAGRQLAIAAGDSRGRDAWRNIDFETVRKGRVRTERGENPNQREEGAQRKLREGVAGGKGDWVKGRERGGME